MHKTREVGALLELRDLEKQYGDASAVAGISLSISPGEFVTILGSSGSGKTTTLNMIAGFVEPTRGEILLDDRPIARLPPYKRDIGMVFQHYAVFPHMTVFDNVAFPLRRRRVSREDVEFRVKNVLELVRLTGLERRYSRQLSGGQQQRVALARAIVFEPRILLMDEPLGALDRKLREFLQLEIRRVQREVGITTLYVTHDQEEALVLSDRIAVMHRGRVEQIASPEDLYERPSSLFVAGFLGESNRLPGRADRVGSDIFIRSDGYSLRAPSNCIAQTGDRVVLVLRPEQMQVHRKTDSTGSMSGSSLSGTLRRVVYLGATRRLEVQLPSGQIVTTRESVGSGDSLTSGDPVTVTWSHDHVVVLPEVADSQQSID